MTDDTTNTTDASITECGHDRFERNHYFHGKLMTARDMAAEQTYHVGQRRAHARSVAGSGIAWGLSAEIVDDGEDAIVVTVPEGYAIDDCGRPIVVPQDRERTITDPDRVEAEALTVWLDYEVCLKESVPIEGAESACEDECAYNRVLEVYDLRVESGYPPTVTEADPDEIAKPVPPVRFPEKSDLESAVAGQPAPHDPGLATIAESFQSAAEGGGLADGDATIYLGTFVPGPNDLWKRDEEQPRPHVYTNDMLYAAIARHTADFENPHQDSLIARPQDEDGTDGSSPPGDRDVVLEYGGSYQQGQRLHVNADGIGELAEELGLAWSPGGTNTIELRRLKTGPGSPIGEIVSEVPVDEEENAVIETTPLDGAYVLSIDGDQAIGVDPDGVRVIATEPEDVVEIAFHVEPAAGAASGPGARLRVLHDRSSGGAVDVVSGDGSVEIAAAPGVDDSHSEVDLSVEDFVNTVVEERIEPLERYAMEKALKYTALVFEGVGDAFGDDARDTADAVAALARGAADGRLEDGTSAEAAAERDLLNRDWTVDEHLSGDVFRTVVGRLNERQQDFAATLAGEVTEDSRRRLQLAMERLDTAIQPNADTLALATAQDDVADAVEWLEPTAAGGEAEATFEEAHYELSRGDVAAMTVNLEYTDTARLYIGGADVGYESEVALTDGNGNGTVTVRMNTFLAGREADGEARAFAAAETADAVDATLHSDPLTAVLEPGEYELRLEADGEETDVSVLMLDQRETESVTVARAPGAVYDEIETIEFFDQAGQSNVTSVDEGIVPGETAIVSVEASGVFGAIAADSDTERMIPGAGGLVSLVSADAIEFAVEESAERPKRLNLAKAVDRGVAKIFLAQESHRILLVIDSAEAVFVRDSDEDPLHAGPGEGYTATFRVNQLDALATAAEPLFYHFEFMDAAGSFDLAESDTVLVQSDEQQEITGVTNLAPGTDVSIVARSLQPLPFVKEQDTSIDQDHRFDAEFDFSSVEAGTGFTVEFKSQLLSFSADGEVENTG